MSDFDISKLNLAIDGAKKKNKDDALYMLNRLREIVSLSPDATEEEKGYYISMFRDVIQAGHENNIPKCQRAVTNALNLSSNRGNKPNALLKDAMLVRDIYRKQANQGMSLETAIEHTIDEHIELGLMVDNANGDIQNARRIYYNLIDAIKAEQEAISTIDL